MQRARHVQGKLVDRRLKTLAVLGHAEVRAAHRPDRRRDHGPARVFEMLARLQQRLVPDDAEPLHFLHVVLAVRDDPVTGDQLRRDLSGVADRQRVRECVLTVIGVGLFRQVAGFHRNGELILTHGVSAVGNRARRFERPGRGRAALVRHSMRNRAATAQPAAAHRVAGR